MFELMLLPFGACIILVGIHAYLGLHVVKRGVIFVDLALAQVSALGSTIGFLVGYELHAPENYWIALAFTIAGASVFSISRSRNPKVPHEALIGTVYVVSAAAAILVLSQTPEGGEELKAIMVGHLLFIEWSDIVKILFLYSGVGLIHWFARHKLLLISEDPDQAFAQGLQVRKWDFLFYASFGVVVTSSVQIAGVLLVFTLLIVPSLCGIFLANTIRTQLSIAWLVGLITCTIGLISAYHWDLPTGATVVCVFGLSLIVCALLGHFRST